MIPDNSNAEAAAAASREGPRTKKIRVHVEIYSHDGSTDYEDLPGNWDAMTAAERDVYLTDLAKDYLFEAAGSGATVVEVDEHGKEID